MVESTQDTANEFFNPGNLGKIMDHESDGIHEFDNPMPFWWSSLFWLTIGFSWLYFMYYTVGVGPGAQREYQVELGVFYQAQFGKLGELKPIPATIAMLANDPKMMKAAQGLYSGNCAVCHAADGGGLTGPNLCDNEYINIKNVQDIFKVISGGVVSKGMPQWSNRFSEPQLVLLTSYVAHLRGTTPSAPKPSQGVPIPPWATK